MTNDEILKTLTSFAYSEQQSISQGQVLRCLAEEIITLKRTVRLLEAVPRDE